MRTEDDLIADLFQLSPNDWNDALANELGINTNTLDITLNWGDYGVNEDNNKPVSKSTELTEPIESTSTILTTRRNISSIHCDYGKVFRGNLFFGINFNNVIFPGMILDMCTFRNCLFTECEFPSTHVTLSKFFECQFNGCNLDNSSFNKVGLFGSMFINCNMEHSTFFDCILHIVAHYGCEIDAVNYTSSTMINTDFESCSMKKIKLSCNMLNACNIINSNCRNARLIDNRFLNSSFQELHVESAFNATNIYMGCSSTPELQEFLNSTDGTEENTEEDENTLTEKSFEEIMGDQDEDE